MSTQELIRAIAYVTRQLESGAMTTRDIALLVREFQISHGLGVDGMPGVETLGRLRGLETDAEAPSVSPNFDGPLERVPRNRADVIALLGNPGVGVVDRSWYRANIVTVRDLPGVPTKWFFETHRLIEPYIREALRRARAATPTYAIERAASFVFRHQRHDTPEKARREGRAVRPLSYHSWGVAFDVDPSLNQAVSFATGQRPEPFSREWRVRWPSGLPREFVEAVESVGFAWGGRWATFCDPMHFEFVGKTDIQV